MTAYTRGFEATRTWLHERRRSPSLVFERLADLRRRRAMLVPGSDQWMETIGETTALLRSFPHLAAREPMPRLHESTFSPTKPRPDGAGVE
jgi:hypothetical protein